jgi:hypothetical protein
MQSLDYEITSSGVLINVHLMCWTKDQEKINELSSLEKKPLFFIEKESGFSPVLEFLEESVPKSKFSYNIVPGENFLNPLPYNGFVLELEHEIIDGEPRTMYECVVKGFSGPIEYHHDINSDEYFAHLLYPIMINFKTKEDRERALTECHILNWIVTKMIGFAHFEYTNAPEGVETLTLGLASNNATAQRFRSLYRHAKTFKKLLTTESIYHDPYKLLVIKSDKNFIVPFVSLSTYCEALTHLPVAKAIENYMTYLREFFFYCETLNTMCHEVVVIQGNMQWLGNNGVSQSDLESISVKRPLNPLKEEILWGRKPTNEDTAEYSSSILLRHPKVGEFALLSTWYDKDKNPLYKSLRFPTSAEGFDELFDITDDLDALLAGGNSNHTYTDLLLQESTIERLVSLLFNAPTTAKLN